MEMTVMMVAERDIPLAELRNKLLDIQHIRLRQTMYNEDELKPLADKHKVLLAKIKLSAMGKKCSDTSCRWSTYEMMHTLTCMPYETYTSSCVDVKNRNLCFLSQSF